MKAKTIFILLCIIYCSLFTIHYSFAQNLAGGSSDGSAMVQDNPCTPVTYTNIFKGGSYDGDNMVQGGAACAATVYTNIFKGGSYDGYNMVQGGAACAPVVYTNTFSGGTCGGGYVSVKTCAAQTWTHATCVNITLPIELLSFTASLTNKKKVLLEWITASETNNDYFTIERTKEGITYETVGKMNGADNSSMTLYYSMLDENPYLGISYYRLKQTDYDGKFEYSPLVAVNIEGLEIVIIYPNPANTELEYLISSSEADDVEVLIIDAGGKRVLKNTEKINKGLTKKRLNIANLSSGNYILQIATHNNKITQKQFLK